MNEIAQRLVCGQAVILAAGRGTRMGELTDNCPKGLLRVGQRTLLEYALDVLPDTVKEVIIVVGYLGSMIHEKFGAEYYGKRLFYVEQEEIHGTAAALWQAKDILKDRFLVLMADDLYDHNDVAKVASAKEWALLVGETNEGGKIVTDEQGHIVDIVEGAHSEGTLLASANVFLLDPSIFSAPLVPKAPDSAEYGLPQTMLAAAKTLNKKVEPIRAANWIQISRPEDLNRAESLL